MEEIVKIAADVSKPLSIGGMVSAFLFLAIRQILSMQIFTNVTGEHTKDILLVIINKLFWLSVIAIVLGFAFLALPYFRDEGGGSLNGTNILF